MLYSFSEIFRIYFETLFLQWAACNLQKKSILDQRKLESYIWADARHLKEQEYIIGINFRPWNIEKMNTTRFRKFLVFMNFSIFQLNLQHLYLREGTIFEADFFTVSITHRALQDRITFDRFEGLMCFYGRNSVESSIYALTNSLAETNLIFCLVCVVNFGDCH